MPDDQTDYLFTFDGYYESIAQNLLSNLTHRGGWGVTYTETYTNSYDQPVYMIGSIYLQRALIPALLRNYIDSIWAVMTKVTRKSDTQTEVTISVRYVRAGEMGPFSRQFRRSQKGVVSEIVRFCKSGYQRRGLLNLGGDKSKRR